MDPISHLRNPKTVRARARFLYTRGLEGNLTHFSVKSDRIGEAVRRTLHEIKTNYPTLDVPFHSRWRHFDAGGIDRVASLKPKLEKMDRDARARYLFELVIISVLLDAGAGATWKYQEKESGKSFSRSEGLAVASFRMFEAGIFSNLKIVSLGDLSRGFQVSSSNPMIGLPGRAKLISDLGNGTTPSMLYEILRQRAVNDTLAASQILEGVLQSFSHIWPGRITLRGENLGDVWRHSKMKTADETDGLVPFHKLSQWLTYSLIEPLEEAGIKVIEVDELTGLPEYRNGGLFVDVGVLMPRNKNDITNAHRPGDEFVVEWRALTIALLDIVADEVRKAIGKTPTEFPLARVLQGGTWSAGRQIANELRPNGTPPFVIESDGTVF